MYSQVGTVLAIEHNLVFHCQITGGVAVFIILQFQSIKQASESQEGPVEVKDL